jgi:hypothetical protein
MLAQYVPFPLNPESQVQAAMPRLFQQVAFAWQFPSNPGMSHGLVTGAAVLRIFSEVVILRPRLLNVPLEMAALTYD